MSRRLHPSVVIAEEAHLLLQRAEAFAARRDLHQADKANLWPVLNGLREIRDRHRAQLGQLYDMDAPTATATTDATPTLGNAAGQGDHHADF
ncbi:hypothetical protein FVW20_00615 [Desulfovibrio oxamicus]|uniref:Uncharacterized protein n=1 Tax=Nitratidesulfovibrio oxamicus TaxID=32016 RepID=A0ABS0IZF0_9BACT|nr:hypothetical protein [Nitratidesulfovibrio oxamicus]MBG3875565.1 hypothetical protein [Nitratidesulfovibrio oxamicus]